MNDDIYIAYTKHQADGAIPNGERIVKINSEPNDAHRDGSLGKVIGSIAAPDVGIGYFIEWDDAPGVPVLAAAKKIARAS